MNITFAPNQINYTNRAVAYGDGCFTTLLYRDGALLHLDEHMLRLRSACQQLAILGFDNQALMAYLRAHVVPQLKTHCVLKILVSVAGGGRGYLRAKHAMLDVFITSHPIPDHYAQWQTQGITLGVSQTQLAKQPLLAGIKHLNRLEQVLVKHEGASYTDDAIVLDTDGMMVEVSAANLFWRQGLQWYTPDLHFCGVAGVFRNRLLNAMQHSSSAGVPVNFIRARPEILKQVDEVFICNSVMGLVPVKAVCLADCWLTHFDFNSLHFQQLKQYV